MAKTTGRSRGRPKGSKNKGSKSHAAAMEKAAKLIQQIVPDAFEGDAHALLMAVYKDPAQPLPVRVDAAKAAIRYEKAPLAAILPNEPAGPVPAPAESPRDTGVGHLDVLAARIAKAQRDQPRDTGRDHFEGLLKRISGGLMTAESTQPAKSTGDSEDKLDAAARGR
jgi:hypothetical protein